MNFWERFEPASCMPHNCGCEGVRDAFIRQPSTTWSSLAFMIAGFAIYRYIKPKSYELKLWTLVCVLMGVTSFLGHMSFIRLTLALDFASIILVLSFFPFIKIIKKYRLIWMALFYVSVFFVMYSLDKWTKIGTCLMIFAFAKVDILKEFGYKFYLARDLQISLGVLIISFTLFVMDEMHIGCDPFSYFQLHSLWHIGTAISMFFYGKWRLDVIRER